MLIGSSIQMNRFDRVDEIVFSYVLLTYVLYIYIHMSYMSYVISMHLNLFLRLSGLSSKFPKFSEPPGLSLISRSSGGRIFWILRNQREALLGEHPCILVVFVWGWFSIFQCHNYDVLLCQVDFCSMNVWIFLIENPTRKNLGTFNSSWKNLQENRYQNGKLLSLSCAGLGKSSTNCYVALGLEGHEFKNIGDEDGAEWWLSINVKISYTSIHSPFGSMQVDSVRSPSHPSIHCRFQFHATIAAVDLSTIFTMSVFEVNIMLTFSIEFVTVCLAWISIKGTDINGMVSFHSLRFQVHVPSNATLMPVRLHQAPVCCDLVIWRTIGSLHDHGGKDSSAMCWWG